MCNSDGLFIASFCFVYIQQPFYKHPPLLKQEDWLDQTPTLCFATSWPHYAGCLRCQIRHDKSSETIQKSPQAYLKHNPFSLSIKKPACHWLVFLYQKQRVELLSQCFPRFNHGIWIQRNRLNALLNQPFRKILMI